MGKEKLGWDRKCWDGTGSAGMGQEKLGWDRKSWDGTGKAGMGQEELEWDRKSWVGTGKAGMGREKRESVESWKEAGKLELSCPKSNEILTKTSQIWGYLNPNILVFLTQSQTLQTAV